jgi:hypothetical protein
MATAATQAVAIPIGTIKSFGRYGPEYQVLGQAEPMDGKRRVRIVLVRTGEETTYGFDAIMAVPEAL